MEIRRGTPGDFEKVVRLLRVTFPQDEAGYYWSFLHFDPFFRPEDVWLVEEDGEIVSCLWILRRFFSDGERVLPGGGVANVATHPEFRGKGLASSLMERAIDAARSENLAFLVLVTEIPAFYERFGFRDCRKWMGWVEPEGEGEAEIMRVRAGEILEHYGVFYHKRQLFTPVRNHSYLRGMRRWNRYSAHFREGKRVAFWGKNGRVVGYFLPGSQEITVFDFFFSEEKPENVLSFLRKLGKPVRLFHHPEILTELGVPHVRDRETVMVLSIGDFPERLYLPPADYF
ncbi:MAG: GNAT family N-acetyltransferase [Atribacterota bacterium]|nr:GNAT family N-acetyltransferase [Atribacterota bacterium]